MLNKLNAFLWRNYDEVRWWNTRQCALRSRLSIFYRARYWKMLRLNNSFIPLSVEFGGKPTLPHGMNGLFISAGAKIGSGCTIYQQVTIGSNTLMDSKRPGSPVIGDNVLIGAGAKIIGGVRVGNNVRIGANCVIVKDIPDNATVVLSSPVLIQHDTPRENRPLPIGEYLKRERS